MSITLEDVRKEMVAVLDTLATNDPISNNELDEIWQQLNRLQALSQVEITRVQYMPETHLLDEYVEIGNRGTLSFNISGWNIQAGSPDQAYIFPNGTILNPNERLRVTTSGATPYSFNSNRPIWNNQGDLATLNNAEGQEASSMAYGRAAHTYTVISNIHYEDNPRNEGNEFVEMTNLSSHKILLDGWQLEAIQNKARFVFSAEDVLEPFASIKVFTKKTELKSNEYNFNNPKSIWNDQGGECKLFDHKGLEVSNYIY